VNKVEPGPKCGSSSTAEHREKAGKQVRYAIVTVSDTRTMETDSSGSLIQQLMSEAGHELMSRTIVPDQPDQIANSVRQLAAVQQLQAILLTGGTGLSPRDQTPEAVKPLLDMEIPGFGELFRVLSMQEIGPAAMLSRAFAGKMGGQLIFCLPGSTNAVRLATSRLIAPELPHLVYHALNG
jgi:molybdenum cofactor biosynthesis protein B